MLEELKRRRNLSKFKYFPVNGFCQYPKPRKSNENSKLQIFTSNISMFENMGLGNLILRKIVSQDPEILSLSRFYFILVYNPLVSIFRLNQQSNLDLFEQTH